MNIHDVFRAFLKRSAPLISPVEIDNIYRVFLGMVESVPRAWDSIVITESHIVAEFTEGPAMYGAVKPDGQVIWDGSKRSDVTKFRCKAEVRCRSGFDLVRNDGYFEEYARHSQRVWIPEPLKHGYTIADFSAGYSREQCVRCTAVFGKVVSWDTVVITEWAEEIWLQHPDGTTSRAGLTTTDSGVVHYSQILHTNRMISLPPMSRRAATYTGADL